MGYKSHFSNMTYHIQKKVDYRNIHNITKSSVVSTRTQKMSENAELRAVRFKAMYWSVEETEDYECIIHVSGLTENQETVQVQVEGFTPYVYLELPRRIKWNKAKCNAVFKHFKNIMKQKGPIKYKMFAKSKLHFKKRMNCMFFTFPTNQACRDFSSKCSRSKYHISGVGSFNAGEFKVHEQNIDAILKFTASRKISLSGWLEIKEKIKSDEEDLSVEERKFSSADIDLYADWRDVSPHSKPDTVITKPKYCSFDIECYSKNHNAREPDAQQPENVVFQISMIFGRLGEEEKKQNRILLTLFDPHDIPGVTIIRCKTERELLLKFKDLIQSEDPDVFIGYNIMKFDWNYMIQRAERGGYLPRFMELSRIIGKKAVLQEISWGSSAYGQQSFKFPNCHGRTNLDVILEVERNYRLPQYSLGAVGEHFLKETKDDISHRQLFMLFQLTAELLHRVKGKLVSALELREIKLRILDILPLRKTHGVVRKLRKKLLFSTPETIEKYIRKALTLTGKYCVQDTALPIKLVNKLNLYTTMEQMSNVMHVPMSYLHTRGQQIKVLAQIFRETIFNNLVIPFQTKKKDGEDDQKYQGAIVIEANPGDYNNVGTLDFASLYPTTMIAFNICYTTILEDTDPTPDEECHVLAWEDHVGCPHDPQKRKKKKEDVLCAKHRYRFLKVKISYDEKTGKITRKNEGLMPRLERNLLATRKEVKKEMFKAEARLKMHQGKATDDEIALYKKCNFEIVKAGSLGKNEAMMLEITVGVLNAKQLAVKVSANSAYGAMGAKNGFIPLIPGAASVTAMGRKLITMAIDKIRKTWSNCKLVYGDTDSCMIHFEGATLKESFDLCAQASKIVTHHLKCWILQVQEDESVTTDEGTQYAINKITSRDADFKKLSYDDKIRILEYESVPIDLEFENMYGRFLLLTKKRYVAYSVNRDGELLAVVKKGVVLARRDNSNYLRLTYKKMTDGILDDKPEEEVMQILYTEVDKLFTRQVPDTNLIIYTGVKNVMNYAKKKEKKSGRDVVDVYYLDENGEAIDDPVGPLDPRLVYPNYPQCLLSLKMLRRGTDVPPNTRLEYLYLENSEAQHQGEKAEDYTYYKENKDIERFKPDYLHYVEKQLLKPVTELLEVKYPKEPVLYEKLDDAFSRAITSGELGELKRSRLAKIRTFNHEIHSYDSGCAIGWDAVRGLKKTKTWRMWVDKKERKVPRNTEDATYKITGKEAKASFIIDSSKKSGMNEFSYDHPTEAKVIDICKRWKARAIIDRLHKQNGIKKKPCKKPTQTGEKLRINTKVILLHNMKGQTKGTMAKVISINNVGGEGKLARYQYELLIDGREETIISGVPRRSITTYYYRDSTVMKDILKARVAYRQTVCHLKKLFSPVIFADDA
jgi:DNA polymerase delta subunit 1